MSWSIAADVPVTLDYDALQQRLGRVLARSARPKADIALQFISHEKSRALNVQYRQKAHPGNVLSFPVTGVPEGEQLLGDVFIAYPLLRKDFSDDLSDEDVVVFLAVHGFLHLLGYDHDDDASEAAMERLHEQLVT